MRITRVVSTRRRPPARPPREIAAELFALVRDSYLVYITSVGEVSPERGTPGT